MTREEAIKMLKSKMDGHTDTSYEWAETVRMAIKALSQQTDTLDVLQKIRQEISHITDMEVVRGGLYVREFEVAEIIDKHISEYTGEKA